MLLVWSRVLQMASGSLYGSYGGMPPMYGSIGGAPVYGAVPEGAPTTYSYPAAAAPISYTQPTAPVSYTQPVPNQSAPVTYTQPMYQTYQAPVQPTVAYTTQEIQAPRTYMEEVTKTIQVPKTVMEDFDVEYQQPKIEMETRTIQVCTQYTRRCTVQHVVELSTPIFGTQNFWTVMLCMLGVGILRDSTLVVTSII